MVGAYQNFNGSRDLTTPLSGMICRHMWNRIYYDQPAYQIGSFYLYNTKCEKWDGLG